MYLYYDTEETGAGFAILDSVYTNPCTSNVFFTTQNGHMFTLPCRSKEDAEALLQDFVNPLDGACKTLDKYKVLRRGGIFGTPVLDFSNCELDMSYYHVASDDEELPF